MEDFNFKSGTQIIFGKDTENDIGKYVSKYSKKILIHYGGNYLNELGIIDRVTTSLKNYNVEYVILDGVVPNPRLSLVNEGINLCRKEKIDFILAIGGGSSIDSAKAISMGVKYKGDVWDFYTGDSILTEALKVGVILTIPGSGSEMSMSSIITNENEKLKYGVDSELIVPEFSILNPEMCYTIPPYLIACGIADILSHLFERYFTPTQNVILSDRILEGAMKSILEIGPKLMEDPKNYDYCAEFMWMASIAHNGMLDAGRVSDWASHRIEHEISALYDITHGAGMAIIFPAWMKYTKEIDINRFNQLAVNVFNISENTSDKDRLANEGIKCVENFFEKLGLKIKLTDAGIPLNKFEEMAAKALGFNHSIGNFKKLNKEDIVKILELSS